MPTALLNLYEAAAHLRMAAALIKSFTVNCPKYGDGKILTFTEQNSLLYFSKAELNEYDTYLHAPWPTSPSASRASIPDVIKHEIKKESAFHCALCQWAHNLEIAHIEPWAKTRSNHPHNLIAVCPNHHTQYDVLPTATLTIRDIKRIKNENLDRLRAAELLFVNLVSATSVDRLDEYERRLKTIEDRIISQRLPGSNALLADSLDSAEPMLQAAEPEVEQSDTELENMIRAVSAEILRPDFRPDFWTTDRLSKFMSDAYDNIQKTFINNPALGKRLIALTELSFEVIDNVKATENFKKVFAKFLFMRSHSMLLAALRLGTSGQFPEAYSMLRGSLMQNLIAVQIAESDDNLMTYLRQNHSDSNAAKARSLFRRSRLLKTVEKRSKSVASYAQFLVTHAEQWGEAGQPFDLFGNLQMQDNLWTLPYMGNSSMHFLCCLKQIARTQICCLLLMELVFPEQFKLLSIDLKIRALMQGL